MSRLKNPLMNEQGVSLVAVLISIGLVGLLASTTATLISSMTKGQMNIVETQSAMGLNDEIKILLTDNNVCDNSFNTIFANTGLPEPTQIVNVDGVAQYIVGNDYEQDSLRIVKMEIMEYSPESVANQYQGRLNLYITYLKRSTNTSIKRRIPLSVTLNDGSVNPSLEWQITTCFTNAAALNDVWVLKTNQDIYYAANNVAIGTSDPVDNFGNVVNLRVEGPLYSNTSLLTDGIVGTGLSPATNGTVLSNNTMEIFIDNDNDAPNEAFQVRDGADTVIMHVDESRAFGFGTNDPTFGGLVPTAKIGFVGDVYAQNAILSDSAIGSGVTGANTGLFYSRNNLYLRSGNGGGGGSQIFFQDGANTRLTINGTGDMGVGAAPIAGSRMTVAGNVIPSVANTGSLGTAAQPWANVFTTTGTVSVSDRRKKSDIKDSDLGLEFILSLRPVTYKVISEPEQRTHYGFIAQEVESELEGRDFAGLIKEDSFLGLNYDSFISPMVKAIQKLFSDQSSNSKHLAFLEEKVNQQNLEIKKLNEQIKSQNLQLKMIAEQIRQSQKKLTARRSDH